MINQKLEAKEKILHKLKNPQIHNNYKLKNSNNLL
jgi:hypothetical protein